MTTTAISAQGSTLTIGVTAAAKTITAATKANPGVFTAAAHGLATGDVGIFASLGGMVEANGLAGVVGSVPSTSTFTIAGLNTTAFTTYTTGGTFTPGPQALNNWVNIGMPGGTKAELDVTNLGSTSKEFIAGLGDNGEATLGFHSDQVNVGQQVLRSSKAGSGNIASTFVWTLPNGKTRTFLAFVKQFGEPQTGVDGVVTSSATLRITGDVTYA